MVRHRSFDSNDVLETELLTGQTGCDVVGPSGVWLARGISAGVTNVVGQANGNRGACALVREDLRQDPAIYPTRDVMRRLHPYHSYSLEEVCLFNRSWTRVRKGQ